MFNINAQQQQVGLSEALPSALHCDSCIGSAAGEMDGEICAHAFACLTPFKMHY
jgi:hypothetical protein